MYKYSIVSLLDLEFISNRLQDLDLDMPCNVEFVKQVRLALPTCSPFSMADCIRKNSEYRVWCALRTDVLATIKEITNG